MIFTPKIIKNDNEYEKALERVEELFDAIPGTPEFDEMELLVKLIEMYEKEKYPIDQPDAISAIKFRMEQLGLKNKDLVPFIGNKSKVSEVLSGKRELSLSMIRKLNKGLGISAEILIRKNQKILQDSFVIEHCENFPFTEMYNRGWFSSFFQGTLVEAKEKKEEILQSFIEPFDIHSFKESYNRRSSGPEEKYQNDILLAWRIRVMNIAEKEDLPKWSVEILSDEFFNELSHLSYFEQGPILAKEFLNKSGIHFVIEKHLKGTHLDGSSMFMPDGKPLIALTIRYDRIDSFWFTLFHELAHIKLHITEKNNAFFDDMNTSELQTIEKEADEFAQSMLIPNEIWSKEGLSQWSTTSEIKRFADKYRINAAIPAGKIRYETNNYSVFTNLLGTGKVRSLFE